LSEELLRLPLMRQVAKGVKRSLAASFTKNKSRPFGGLNFWWSNIWFLNLSIIVLSV